MCGRYALNASASQVIEQFELHFEIDRIRETYQREEKEVWPTKVEPVIQNKDGNRQIVDTQWGLQNVRVGGVSIEKPVINATFERLKTSYMWKKAIQGTRCILPITSYFEWKEITPVLSDKYELYWKDKSLVGFAGLKFPFIDKDKKTKIGFVVITMPANEKVSFVHHRQPGIILKKDYSAWLDDTTNNPETLIHHSGNDEIDYIKIQKQRKIRENEPTLF